MKSFLLMSVSAIGLVASISGASAQTYVTTTPFVTATPAVAVSGFGYTAVEGVLPIASGLKVSLGSIVPAYVPLTHTVNVIPATGYVSAVPGVGHLEWTPTGTGFMRLGMRGWSNHIIMPALAGYSYFVSPDQKLVFVNPVNRQVLRILKL